MVTVNEAVQKKYAIKVRHDIPSAEELITVEPVHDIGFK